MTPDHSLAQVLAPTAVEQQLTLLGFHCGNELHVFASSLIFMPFYSSITQNTKFKGVTKAKSSVMSLQQKQTGRINREDDGGLNAPLLQPLFAPSQQTQ